MSPTSHRKPKSTCTMNDDRAKHSRILLLPSYSLPLLSWTLLHDIPTSPVMTVHGVLADFCQCPNPLPIPAVDPKYFVSQSRRGLSNTQSRGRAAECNLRGSPSTGGRV